MKNYNFTHTHTHRFFVAIIATLGLFTSCQQNDEFTNQPTAKQETKQQFVEGVYVKDGTLHFESDVDFFKIMQKIESIPDVQFNNLALKTGFKSYRVKLNRDQAQRTAKIDAWVDSMELVVDSDFLIVGTDPFQDEFIIPEIKSSLYRSIVNEEGVFYIDGVKNVVDGTNISGYSTSNTKSVEPETLIGTRRYVIENETRSISQYPEAKYYCRERSMRIVLGKEYIAGYSPSGMTTGEYVFSMLSITEKKSWGKWRFYNSRHDIRDLKLITSGVYGSTILFDDNIAPEDAAVVNFNYIAPSWCFTSDADFHDAQITFKFTSRGTIEHGHGIYNSKNVDADQYNSNPC